jgi:cytochrome c oxidase subunit 2
MRRAETVAIILVVLATVAIVVASLGLAKRDYTVEILVRSPEKGNFTPQNVTVPVGERATLRLRNVDTVTHGFAIPTLGVEAVEIPSGQVVTVEFTPEQTGSHDFYCTVWCSDYHLQMRGVVEVVTQ